MVNSCPTRRAIGSNRRRSSRCQKGKSGQDLLPHEKSFFSGRRGDGPTIHPCGIRNDPLTAAMMPMRSLAGVFEGCIASSMRPEVR